MAKKWLSSRPWLRRSLLATGVFLALSLTAIVTVRVLLATGPGRAFVEARLEGIEASGISVELEGLDGDLLGEFRFDRLSLSDRQGVFATIDNATLEWSPLAIASRTLKLDNIDLEAVTLLRQPELEASEPSGSSGGSSPLKRYILGSLTVERIEVSEAVAGQEAVFTLLAEAEAGGTEGRANIRLTPLSGTDDRLISDLTWSMEGGLSGDLDVYLSAGGALSRTVGLPPDRDLSARLSARGDLDAWKLDASAALGGADVLVLDASRRSDNLAATGTVNLAELNWVSPELSRFGARLDVEAGTRDGIVTLTARTEQAQLSADAPWPVPEDILKTTGLEFVLQLNDGARLLPRDVGQVGPMTLGGRLRQDAETWRFDGTLGVQDIAVAGYGARQVSGPLLVSFGPETVEVDTNLSVRGAAGLPDAALSLMGSEAQISARAAYSLETQNLFLTRAEFFTPQTRATARGSAQLAAPMSLDISGDFASEALGEMSGARARAASFNWTVRQAAGGPQRMTLQGDVTGLANLPFPAAEWLGNQAAIEAEVSLVEAGPLIERLVVGGEKVDLEASGSLTGETLKFDANLEADAVSNEGLSLGALSLVASMDGTINAFGFTADGNLENLNVPGFSADGVRVSGTGRRTGTGVSGRVDLGARQAAGQPLAASTGFAIDAPNWRVDGLDMDWGTLRARADVSGNLENLLALDGTANVSGTPPVEGLPFDAINADLVATGGVLDLDAALDGLVLAGFELPEATLRASGTPDSLNYTATVSGRGELRAIERDVRLDVAGDATRGDEGFVVLSNVAGALGDVTVSSAAPVRLVMGETLSVDGKLQLLGGEMDVSLLQGEVSQLQVSGTPLSLEPVFELLARPGLTGRMDIALDLTANEGEPYRGRAALNLIGLDSTEIDAPQLDGRIAATLAQSGMQAEAQLTGEEGLNISATANAPPVSAGLFGFDASALVIAAEGSGPLATLWTYAGPDGTELQGDFLLTTDVGGGQELTAHLQVNDATFEHGTLGLFLTDLDVDAGFTAGRLTLDTLSAKGREGGTVTGSGAMTLGETGRFEVALSDLIAVRRRGLSATVSGDLAYEMGLESNDVTGNIMIDDAVFSLDALPESRPQTLNVSFRSSETGQVEEERADPTPTRLDIKITAPQQLAVRGRGVNAELGVDASIGGTLVNPEIGGIARIVRGNVEFAGKQFDFVDSTVTISGDPMESRLDLAAEYEASDFTARINISGTPNSPEISMTGSPDLPEDQVLSRVLFGRSPAELSALEAAQLAAALSQLAGGGSGFSLTGSLQDALGLDRVNLGQNADGSASLATGKYLAEDLYLELETTGSGSPGVSLEWTPLANIEVGTTIDPVEGPGFSVQWKRDYD